VLTIENSVIEANVDAGISVTGSGATTWVPPWFKHGACH
jgi:hypothetical protein